MTSLKSDDDHSFNMDELLRIGTMCRELRKEKDMLTESQLRSSEEIRKLELDMKSLSEARSADRKYIQRLERELDNCAQEIGYLQEQLSLRNMEASCLGEHVHSLELKLLEAGKGHERVIQLEEELVKSESERFFLMEELENKEMELQNSNLCIEKLEDAISSMTLESECEIESMKLDAIALEQRSLESKKFQEQDTHEKAAMDGFDVQFHDAKKMVRYLENENRELREKLAILEKTSTMCCQKVEGYLDEWPEEKGESDIRTSCAKLGIELPLSNEMGTSEEILAPLLSRLVVVAESDEKLKDEMKKMSDQTLEYELLVKQLKDELRGEKTKAKEEAEDLTQEMAELRYQITGMLEQECKRRACIEQASIQRIAELETQVQKEQRKSLSAARDLREAQKLAEARSMDARHLRNVLEGLRASLKRNQRCSCGECIISTDLFEKCFDKELVESESSGLGSTDDQRLQLLPRTRSLEDTRLQRGNASPR